MKIECTIQMEYDTAKKAQQILQSLQVDDVDFVTSTVKDKTIKAKIQSTSITSMLHTLDDYLACLSVAEKIVDKN